MRANGVVGDTRRCRSNGARAAFAVLLALACSHPAPPAPARSAEEARRRIAAAVRARDAPAVYDALDLDSQWSIMSIYQSEREVHRLAASEFPPGPRERETERTRAAGESGDAREWFSRVAAELAPFSALEQALARSGADSFAQGPDGRWGYSGLRADLARRKAHAKNALDVVRESAREYRARK